MYEAPQSPRIGLSSTSPLPEKWLNELISELAECPTLARDDGIEGPSDIAFQKAEQFLREVSRHVSDRPDVYPMEERCVVIDFRIPERKSGVMFVIEQDGAGALYERTENSRGRLRMNDASDLLNNGGIAALRRVGIG